MTREPFSTLEEAQEAFEDLVGALQDVYHRLSTLETLEEYGVLESLVENLEATLARHDALD